MGRKNLHEAFQQIEAQKRAQREKEEQAELEARLRADREAEQRADDERRAREAEAAAQPPPDTDVAPLGGLPSAAAPAPTEVEREPAPAPNPARAAQASAPTAAAQARSGAQAHGGAPARLWTEVVAQPVVLALFLLVFALGFFSGRFSTPAVRADGPPGGSSGGDSSGPATAGTGNGAPSGGATGARRDSAPAIPVAGGGDETVQNDPVLARLFDPQQEFTIQLISYNDSEYTRRLSEELVTYLRALDFQASPPLKVGDNLTVLVGAEATQEGLAGTLAALRRTPGPNGEAGAFADARVRTIDDLLGRE
ncbi:MAG: hypothetical protein ACYS26_05995 [Planctomycetota bacterium]|jgi:hypothetical protein